MKRVTLTSSPPSPTMPSFGLCRVHPETGHGVQIAIGEEFLYCVKAAGFADGSVASGRACGLRPVPPYAAPQQRQGAADPDRSVSVVLQAAGDEGEGVGAATSVRPPGPQLSRCAGLEPAGCPWEPGSGVSALAFQDAGPGPAPRLPRSRCAPGTRSVDGHPEQRARMGAPALPQNELLASDQRDELEYRSRYIFGGAVNTADLLTRARHEARLTQSELATRACTSRPTLSAYEHGRTSPTLETAARLLAAAGQELPAVPQVRFVRRTLSRGRTTLVPTSLPRLPLRQALATITLTLHLNWSQPNREFRLAERDRRARVYEIVLREGTPQDVLNYIDGALLVDLWDSLVLPRDVRAAWSEVLDSALQQAPQ